MGWRGLKTVATKLREFVPHYTTTQQQIRCPNYDCEATITTRTRLWGGHPARYVSVETCSLLPKQAAEGGAHVNWVPDIPYQDLNLSGGERLPRYTMGVPCRETCLMLANGEVTRCAGPWRTTGGWWSREERFAFDHFDVQTSDGLVVRLRRDLITGCWQIDAVYD